MAKITFTTDNWKQVYKILQERGLVTFSHDIATGQLKGFNFNNTLIPLGSNIHIMPEGVRVNPGEEDEPKER